MTAIVGFIDLAKGEHTKNYNALAVIRNGKVVAKQYKTLLPTYDVFLEQISFRPLKNKRPFQLRARRSALVFAKMFGMINTNSNPQKFWLKEAPGS